MPPSLVAGLDILKKVYDFGKIRVNGFYCYTYNYRTDYKCI